jgi:hypothetical protein
MRWIGAGVVAALLLSTQAGRASDVAAANAAPRAAPAPIDFDLAELYRRAAAQGAPAVMLPSTAASADGRDTFVTQLPPPGFAAAPSRQLPSGHILDLPPAAR